ncbi:hypothetical protein BJX66DRAFT_63507 [Aspergillus keveii]|uniref:Uncharacterized protein n=1 Tax=Aspergillus keveii TaxID=714993 RepID=A0ABR4GGK5_9EURO
MRMKLLHCLICPVTGPSRDTLCLQPLLLTGRTLTYFYPRLLLTLPAPSGCEQEALLNFRVWHSAPMASDASYQREWASSAILPSHISITDPPVNARSDGSLPVTFSKHRHTAAPSSKAHLLFVPGPDPEVTYFCFTRYHIYDL